MKPSQADVLLVEDSAAEARLAIEALREAHFHVRLHTVSDGAQAMAFLRREGDYRDAPRPHLVLLDLNLPRKDGREVLRDMKEDAELRRIPVVILTTSQAQNDIRRAYELHANCYIQKPLELDGFIDTVRSIHRYWLQLAELPA
ncbi:MAG TPA: response regulator [Chthoniobacteraceae bacterium]|jgi:CheY-like chemotaxis protein|nr:response regulator [Chthoniobacteraceae bacterium]